MVSGAEVAGGGNRSRRVAVIGPVPRNDLVLSCDHAGDLERRLVGLRAAGREEEFFQPLRKDIEEFRTEPGARRRRIAGRDIGQFPRLLGDRLDHPRVLMAQVYAHQLRRKIEIAPARAVGEPAAFRVHDVQRFPRVLESPRAVVGLARDLRDWVRVPFWGQVGSCNHVAHRDLSCAEKNMLRHSRARSDSNWRR